MSPDKAPVYSFSSGYLPMSADLRSQFLSMVRAVLSSHLHEFDSLIGTGLSGALMIPSIAETLNKPYALIRKDHEITHGTKIEGAVYERVLFVDDFVSSGDTLRRVVNTLRDRLKLENKQDAARIVAVYQYQYGKYLGIEAFLPF